MIPDAVLIDLRTQRIAVRSSPAFRSAAAEWARTHTAELLAYALRMPAHHGRVQLTAADLTAIAERASPPSPFSDDEERTQRAVNAAWQSAVVDALMTPMLAYPDYTTRAAGGSVEVVRRGVWRTVAQVERCTYPNADDAARALLEALAANPLPRLAAHWLEGAASDDYNRR